MLYTILKHNCTELEVAVKLCVKNISKLVYCKVLYDAGIEALACARLLCLGLRYNHTCGYTVATSSSSSSSVIVGVGKASIPTS